MTIVIVEQNVHSAFLLEAACVFETGRIVAESSGANSLGNPDLPRGYLDAEAQFTSS